MKTYSFKKMISLISVFTLLTPVQTLLAQDTDIYQANVKQNAYILLDNSGSMDFGVYESNVDYGAMYDYLYDKNNIGDTITGSNYFYNNHEDRNKIYLLKGNIGASIISINGEQRVFTGDAADPDYLWYVNDLIDTHTYIDGLGNLSAEDGKTPRVTVDADGYVLLDGQKLPLGQDTLLQNYQMLYDGSIINDGFGGLLNAPGYYFSGFEGVGNDVNGHDVVEDGDQYIYFFITGNWINMQQMYNLHYTSNPGSFASTGDPVWPYELFPLTSSDTAVTLYDLDYPNGNGLYSNNLSENDTARIITHPGAEQMQIHFSMFDVEGDGRVNAFRYDYLALYDADNNLVAKYDNDNSPEGSWSPVVPGDTVRIKLKTDYSVIKYGYTIDRYRTTENLSEDGGHYLMQNRLDIAKDAMLYVVDEFRGKINWGFATFKYQGSTADGATFGPLLNPTDNDDANRAAIVQQINNTEPMYGTPLGEALQDLFETGYYGRKNSLDNLMCRKNYAIVVSDGFPSGDNDWSRIGGVTFQDFDGDGFTADPYQYTNPPANYYDDVAHWIYTHSWLDKSLISDPAASYENVIPHQISFGAKHPLMQNAAEESGAEYITAYNKAQLVNAFYSLGLMISEAISFTAPVVSVDEANKIQNGDDLYMGQFLPVDSGYWPGNIKQFKLGDGSAQRPDIWKVYDAANNEATDSSGRLLDNLDGFWGDENDANDSDNYGGPDIKEDGVGEVLTERVGVNFLSANYYNRTIKSYVNGSLIDLNQLNISPGDLGLGVSDTLTRNKTINWLYGYSFDADVSNGTPVAPRDWALGAIIHSRPTVIDYFDANDFATLESRYIAAGANDGMLHVFDNATGAEIFAFVPDDVLPKLPAYESLLNQDLVDGQIKLFRQNGQPKYLFFGLRRGGSSYWRINISNSNPATWTVAKFTDPELGQSWSDIEFAKIRTSSDAYKDVAIFSGGYDPVEDNFPEPFNDVDSNGTPFAANGNISNQEWSSNDSNQDIYNNNQYDISNPVGDDQGRAIYVVDVETLNLLFSVKYAATDVPATKGSFSVSTSQTRSDFIYSFPATPSVVTQSESYAYDDNGTTVHGRKDNVLAAIYAPDIYGNMYRVSYDYDSGSPKWQVKHIFSANPGSNSPSAGIWGNTNTADAGRKVFYGPAISWRGSGRYFDSSNYYYPGTEFFNTDQIASLFFGTGDREHPSYKIARNRVYAIYDDSPVSSSTNAVSSTVYKESDLLNLTCDELGIHTTCANKTPAETAAFKTGLETLLLDDAINPDITNEMELDSSGDGENDAKGWYIILEQQADPVYCADSEYPAAIDSTVGGRDYHVGEKVLSKLALFNKTLYFTTYQPQMDNPCAPQGNAFNYALNYVNGAAALNLNSMNDVVSGQDVTKIKDISDRYGKHANVKGIPSAFEIVTRGGKAGAMSSIGGSLVGGGESGFEIPNSNSGIELFYWLER